MGKIHVNYDAVYAETEKLRNHICSNVIDTANAEYNRVQSTLSNVDGGTAAALSEFADYNRKKAMEAADIVEKLLRFMCASAKQIEINEEVLARVIRTGRKQG